MTLSNLPLSEQYRLIAKKWVDADAAANILEESKSAFLSHMMSTCGDIPVSKAEMHVKASTVWKEYLEKMVEARKQAALLKVQLEYIRMQFSEWQSSEATRRAEMKL
jgi:predicted nucleotidyltransferase